MSRSPSPRSLARSVLIAIGLIAMAYLLWAGRDILFVAFFGLLVGIFLSFFTGLLHDRGLHRLLALGIVLVTLGGLTAGAWAILWPTVSEQLSTVSRQLPETANTIADWLQQQYRAVTGASGQPQADLEEEFRARFTQNVGGLLGGALPVINTAVGALAGMLVVLMVGIYTAARPGLYRDGFLRLIPPHHRDRVGETLERSGHSLRRWMLGTLIAMTLVASMVALGLWILNVPAFLALAVIAGALEFIPIVGPILAAIPAIAVALTISPMTAVWVAILYTVIQQIEGDVVTPLVMRGAVRLPPALTVVFQALMAVIFGFLGLLLAVPLLAVVLVAVRTLYVEPLEENAGAHGASASS